MSTPSTEDDLRAAVQAQMGFIATNFVVIAEVIDPESGEQMIAQYCPAEMTQWARIGLMEWSLTYERAAITHD